MTCKQRGRRSSTRCCSGLLKGKCSRTEQEMSAHLPCTYGLQQGRTDFSKNLRANTKFYAPVWLHEGISLLRTYIQGVSG
jgi:hypothetical protein